MRLYALRLERIGGGTIGSGLLRIPCRAWVAERGPVTMDRKFLRPTNDYRKANSAGTRGVYATYLLRPQRIYEISEPLSWSRTDRYHAHVLNCELVRIRPEDLADLAYRLRITGMFDESATARD